MAGGIWTTVGTVLGAIIGSYIPGIGTYVGAVVGGIVGGIVDSLTTPSKRHHSPSFDSSPTYGFMVRNTIDPTTPVAARYGEHMAPLHIVSSHITQVDKRKQAISILGGIGEGEIDSVSDLRLEGASAWDDVTDHPCHKKGNGKRSIFEVSHGYIDEDGLTVKVAGTTKTLTTHYTIEGTDARPRILFKHDAIPAADEAVTYSCRHSPMMVKVSLRKGTSDQSVLPSFQEVAQTNTVNKTITKTGGGYTYRTKRAVEDIVVHIVCPRGLIHYRKGSDAGKTSYMWTSFNIEVRTVSAAGVTGDWVRLLGDKHRKDFVAPWATQDKIPTHSTGEFGIGGKTSSAIRVSYRATDKLYNEFTEKFPGWTTASIVDVRVTKTAKDFTGSKAGRLINAIALEHVTEITTDKIAHPYTALIGIEGVANDQLSGGFPYFQVLGKWLKIKDLAAGGVAAWSDSYPWAVADMITNARYGLGQWFTTSDVNTTAFDTWATFCETSVTNPDGTIEERYRFDGAVDAGEISVDALRRICSQAQGLFVWYEGKWSIVTDTVSTAVGSFTDGTDGETPNIINGSVQWSEPTDDPPNVLTMQFHNRENDWEPDTMTVEDVASLNDGDPIVENTISLYGTTRPSQVARVGNYYIQSARKSRVSAALEVRAIGMKYVPGDVVPVTHEPSGWAAKLFRIMAIEWTQDLHVRYALREYDADVYTDQVTQIRASSVRATVPAATKPLKQSYPTTSVTGLTLTEVDD